MSPIDPFGISDTVVDGRYRVGRVVGQGGFGVVYRAQHLGFESPIALKVLKLPEEWSSARREARLASFQREGRMLFELSHLHPSIVRAFETGTIRGRDGSLAPYLALEWLEGASLDRELRSRRALGVPPLSLEEALALLRAPAEGLARAHAKGIAHRDIKPGNLFISTRDGEQSVKILDFGIAKLVDDTFDASDPFFSTTTATASFTPLYAAPEQWLETLGATGTWTDVHALALVAVELVTGRAPFGGQERGELMAACLASRRPTPAARGVALPLPVEDVLARALAVEPEARFPNAGAFWAALCAAAEWRPADGAPLIELTSRRSGDVQGESPAQVVAQPPNLTGSTAATAPPTSRNRPPALATGGQRLRAGTALLGLVAAAVVAYGVAGRERPASEPAHVARTVAAAPVSSATRATTVLPPRIDGPAPSGAPSSPSSGNVGGVVALPHPPTRLPAPLGPSRGAAPAPPTAPASVSARWRPSVPTGPDPPTASFALPPPEASMHRSTFAVDLDDPGLKRRK